MNLIRYYQFQLRGLHSLESLNEPIHGHLALLNIGLNIGLNSPISSEPESKFLCFIKQSILRDFDKADWRKAVKGEPSGENVILEIARRLKSQPEFDIRVLELQETKKNLFRLDL